MPKRTRLRVCQAKRAFDSAEAALTLAAENGLDLRAYRCDRCRRIHLTSRRKGKRRPPLLAGLEAPRGDGLAK